MNKYLKAPILVCRPILGIPIPTFPQPNNDSGAEMSMITPSVVPHP